MRKTIHFISGFTLPEVLVAAGIMSILVAIMGQVFAGVVEAGVRGKAEVELAREQSYLLSRIAYDVNRAISVSQPLANQAGNTLGVVVPGHSLTYSISEGQLMLAIDGGTAESVTEKNVNVTSFNLQRHSDIEGRAVITVNVTLTSRSILTGREARARTITTTLTTR